MTQPLYTNQLIKEKSPYLLRHAHTPVHWYPWGAEAVDLATAEDKPIFLSIGYFHSQDSTEMLNHIYVSAEVATKLNTYFVSIKVDKEELPHVASVYKNLAQVLIVTEPPVSFATWPLMLFLTPNLLPFVAMTYFDIKGPESEYKFSQILDNLHHMWNDDDERNILVKQAHKAVEVTSLIEGPKRKELLDETMLKNTVEALYHHVDALYGGVQTFPKTLHPLLLHCLFRHGVENYDSRGIFVAERSLQMMAKGGIFDHICGGFYTLAMDAQWRIPYFEKRLVDNAWMALNYAEVGVYTQNADFLSLAQQIISYILTQLYDSNTGAFFNSEQEDENGLSLENNSVTWTEKEIYDLLGAEAQIFCKYYGMSKEGIYGGKNILHIPQSMNVEELEEKCCRKGLRLQDILNTQRSILKKHKQEHARFIKDTLSLTCNNGWMVYVLVQLGKLLGEPNYINIALKTMQFIRENLVKAHCLLRRWCGGDSRYFGILKDYAAVILGSLALFEVGEGAEWLHFAESLASDVLRFFQDEQGGFYSTDTRESILLFRQMDVLDEDGLSGSALLCQALQQLYLITQNPRYLRPAEDILHIAQPYWHAHKCSSLGTLLVAQEYFSKNHRKVFVSLGCEEDKAKILQGIKGMFAPRLIMVWLTHQDQELLRTLLPSNDHCLIPAAEQMHSKIYLLEEGIGKIFLNIDDFLMYMHQL